MLQGKSYHHKLHTYWILQKRIFQLVSGYCVLSIIISILHIHVYTLDKMVPVSLCLLATILDKKYANKNGEKYLKEIRGMLETS